jgi:hypothetical protein
MRSITVSGGILILSTLLTISALGSTHTAGIALVPEGEVAPTRTRSESPVPLFPPCGVMGFGVGTCTICDGYIDEEWAQAEIYDISDTCGQSDGLPNEPGSVYLYMMMNDTAAYFGIDVPCDLYQDYYDQAGLYFDDSDDGCWPAATTNEGNVWVVDDNTGICYLIWRWWQDTGCAGNCNACMDYYGSYTDYGLEYYLQLCCCGMSTQSGHVQIEVGFQFGDAATEDYHIQTYLNLGETCGFYIYYRDQYYYDFMGEMPCTGDPSTYIWPCSWPCIIMTGPKFYSSMDPYQTQVPIGGTLDFAKYFHNSTYYTATVYDTMSVYRDGKLLKEFVLDPWIINDEEDVEVYFALTVPKKDHFIGWDLTLLNRGVAVAGDREYAFEDSFDFHIEPGHKSMVQCPGYTFSTLPSGVRVTPEGDDPVQVEVIGYQDYIPSHLGASLDLLVRITNTTGDSVTGPIAFDFYKNRECSPPLQKSLSTTITAPPGEHCFIFVWGPVLSILDGYYSVDVCFQEACDCYPFLVIKGVGPAQEDNWRE